MNFLNKLRSIFTIFTVRIAFVRITVQRTLSRLDALHWHIFYISPMNLYGSRIRGSHRQDNPQPGRFRFNICCINRILPPFLLLISQVALFSSYVRLLFCTLWNNTFCCWRRFCKISHRLHRSFVMVFFLFSELSTLGSSPFSCNHLSSISRLRSLH
jgi:hypothetical protein